LLIGAFLSGVHRRGARRQRAVDRLLRGVRVGRAGVDPQLLQHRAAEPVLREHAPHRQLDDALGRAAHEALEGLRADAARVAGVPVVELVLALAQRDVELGGVDHDDVVAHVDVRRPDRLVLAPQQRGDLGRDAPEALALGIDDEPRALDVGRFGGEGPHGGSYSLGRCVAWRPDGRRHRFEPGRDGSERDG
jgi:hypothetical protein